jgi:hypothetical protein
MLSIEDFGDELLRTQDLDPVYVALYKCRWPEKTLAAFCLAYWCFYDVVTASVIAEAKTTVEFWKCMTTAALNTSSEDGSKPWARGAERRHYRGQQAVDSMQELVLRYGTKDPRYAVNSFLGGDRTRRSFSDVSRSVKIHRGFGDWIAFKIADMAERVLGVAVDFSNCELGIYKDPRQGAALALIGDWKTPISDDQLKTAVEKYVGYWRRKRAKAPPAKDRLVNVQEIETIFCKYKSHVKGHYPVGKDTFEYRQKLAASNYSLAQNLLESMPNG